MWDFGVLGFKDTHIYHTNQTYRTYFTYHLHFLVVGAGEGFEASEDWGTQTFPKTRVSSGSHKWFLGNAVF